MKRLLNQSEAATLNELNATIAQYGMNVNPKVRLAEVLPIETSGISDDLFKFALMSHFDFVITDETHEAQFAVEFDGPSHDLPKSKELDKKKDELCSRFEFPLLRIKIDYLPKRYRGFSLLRWIIDVYQLQRAFDDAQERGQIPPDEPFDPFFIFSTNEKGETTRFPYWISLDANLSLKELHKQGKIAHWGTNCFIGEDTDGNIKGIEYVKVTETHGAIVRLSMRPQLFPVNFSDLMRELLLIFTYEKVKEYLVSGDGLTPLPAISRLMQAYQSHCKMLSRHGYG